MPKRVFEPKEKEQLKLTMLGKEDARKYLHALADTILNLVFRKG